MFSTIPVRERRDLLIAWLAISLAFMIIFTRGNRFPPETIIFFFILSLLTVGVGFLVHEMAHKYMAIHYGYWAEFVKDSTMLTVAIAIAALTGFVFAAPGATMIYGQTLSKRENGIISVVGPISNLVLFALFALLTYLALIFESGYVLTTIAVVGMKINGMLAAFNMLPIGNLDGKKVLSWNPLVFGVVIILAFLAVYVAVSGLLFQEIF
ncbi:MAG: peptidase M50 [Methanomicrobiales archaeon]|jgi:Zn-dependent protease|nr:peptidase M50 [Methanomicrobiales archaeon]